MSEVKICPNCGERNNAVQLNFCMYCRHDFNKTQSPKEPIPIKIPEIKKEIKEELKVDKSGQLLLF